MLVDPLATDQWVLQPCTPASVAIHSGWSSVSEDLWEWWKLELIYSLYSYTYFSHMF